MKEFEKLIKKLIKIGNELCAISDNPILSRHNQIILTDSATDIFYMIEKLNNEKSNKI